MNYTISFTTPYSLDEYEAVTLQERIERQLKSFISDEYQVNYIAKK